MTLLRLTAELGALGASWVLLGWQLLPRAVRGRVDALLRWTTALALGAGATAVLLTALAAFHLFGRHTIWLLAIGEAVAAIVIAAVHRRELAADLRLGPSASRMGRASLVLLAVILLLTLIATCAPPTAMDATVYHLRAPAEFLRTGTWSKLDQVQSFQPLYVEMLFAEGLVIGGGPLAALVHWLLGVAAIGAAACWARRFKASAIWGALVFGGTMLWVWESTSAFVDLGLGLFASLSLLFVLSAELSVAGPVLGGFCAGLAAGTKFTGLLLAMLCAGVAFVRARPERRRAWRDLLAVGGIALLVAFPWYLRDFLLTGNPIFPLANKLFGLRPEPLASVTYGLGRDPLHLLMSPFDLLARGEDFDQGWATGPAYLAFVPIGLLLRRSRETVLVAAFSAVWWLIWFYTSPQTRLLIPILPSAAGLAAVGIGEVLDSRRPALRAVTVLILGVALCGALGAAALYVRIAGPVVFAREPVDAYLRRNSWHYQAYKVTEALVPARAQVAVTGNANNFFYLNRRARWLGQPLVSSHDLMSAGFDYELRITRCPVDDLDDPRRTVLSEGSYDLRASRLGGGVLEHDCYRLSTVSPGRGETHR